MKKALILCLALALCLTLLPLSALGEEAEYGPGLSRGKTALGYDTAQHMAELYGLDASSLWWYPSADGKPLNAYMMTHADCEVGINKDDMYPVKKKGLVTSITKYLKEWAGEIEDASQGAIRFVDDPNQADILISARQLYKYYATYSGSGFTTKGYSSEVTFFAYNLSNRDNVYSVKKTRTPAKSTSVSGRPSKFWKNPPDFEGSDELKNLVESIMGWYGFNDGGRALQPQHVAKARQALIDRGYLKAEPGETFDAEMEAAVKLLQKDYGLEETGKIDRVTLVALYYDKASVDEMLAKYPLPTAEEAVLPAEEEAQ